MKQEDGTDVWGSAQGYGWPCWCIDTMRPSSAPGLGIGQDGMWIGGVGMVHWGRILPLQKQITPVDVVERNR
jgi:hypothetical protein